MSIGYATQRGISGRIRRWSNLVSYTTPPVPPLTFTFNPSGNFTTTGTFQFKKTAGGTGWNSNVFGGQGLTTGTMICKALTGGWMCGVSTNNTTVSYPSIDWGISVQTNGNLEVYNSGGSGGTITGGWNTSTEIKMVWTTTQIFYYTNNVLQRTYTRPNANAMYINWSFEYVNAEGVLLSFQA